jgi:hypothetical protein
MMLLFRGRNQCEQAFGSLPIIIIPERARGDAELRRAQAHPIAANEPFPVPLFSNVSEIKAHPPKKGRKSSIDEQRVSVKGIRFPTAFFKGTRGGQHP